MEDIDSTLKTPRSPSEEQKESKSGKDKNNNTDDRARTEEMLRKLQQLEENASKQNTLVAADFSMRKSASFQNITELSEDCSIDLRRRGSDPRSAPGSPAVKNRTPGGRRQKPWELRRSSTPIPGELDVSSVLRKALGRFSSQVGHTSVKENEESDE